MSNIRDEILRKLTELRLSPRMVRRESRIVHDSGDGATRREVLLTGLKDGVFQTVHIRERVLLSCGHIAEPAVVCPIVDEAIPRPHSVCAADARICSGCSVAGCSRHIAQIEDQFLCSECAHKAGLDAIAQRLIDKIMGAFK